MELYLIYILPAFGLVGLVYMLFISSWVKKQPVGSEKMVKLSGYIANGAMALLKAEYRMLAIFVVIAGSALGVLSVKNFIPAGLFNYSSWPDNTITYGLGSFRKYWKWPHQSFFSEYLNPILI